jgi:hypothetical protein
MRRTGDPNVVRKAGAKASKWSKLTSAQFREWSPRTRARYSLALSLLADQPMEVRTKTVQRATRPNGSFNVSKLLNIATMAYVESHDIGDA